MMKRNIESSDMGIGGKRACPEKASKVLHIRNVSSEANERDITNLAIPFGPITYFVLTRKTGQALMEMQHEESARAMIEYYTDCPPQLYSKNIVMQFSRHENLSGTGMHKEAQAAVSAANEDVKKLCSEEPRLVLHVTIESWEGPRLGHLHFFKLLHKFGNILRIIVFVQNQNPQALVEFENEISAHVAKLQLSSTNSFYGRPVRIEFSNRKSLDIKHESDTGRDYTISPVLKEELNSIPSFQQPKTNFNDSFERHNDYQPMRPSNVSYTAAEALQILQPFLQAANNNPNEALPLLQNLAPTLSSLLVQSNARSYDNGRLSFDNGRIGFDNGRPSFDQGRSNFDNGRSSFDNGRSAFDNGRSNFDNGRSSFDNGRSSFDNGRSSFDNGRSSNRSLDKSMNSPVLIVANLNEDRVTPDALFILFGAYGDVLRVKILYNKKNTALIQFVDGENAERAYLNLNNVNLFGNQLRINFSKHVSISMPKPDEQNSVHLNKDYSTSRLHRFKRPSSRTVQNIYPPGVVLHFASLPDKYEESNIIKLLEDEGFSVVKVKILSSNQRKMALVQMESVETAIEALIRLHDFDLGDTRLRVSFSKGFITN